jgi:pyruvate dehydrogenase E2 component (dihydrolipoamide acetyltransferase)
MSSSTAAPPTLRGKKQKMVGLRKIIAQRMVESLHVAAQLTTVIEVDLSAVAGLRDRAKRDFEAREGVKLSYLPFLAKAALEALREHPKVNASIDADGREITYHDVEHLGVAVDTDKGLYVPVIRNAGDLSLAELTRQIADVAARTRDNKVKPEELAGGTFTITNTGSRGALFDTPIINQPQVAILGTGAVVKRPVAVTGPDGEDKVEIRPMAYLALSYDHRLVDGADAARFLATLKRRLEVGDFAAEVGF